MPLTRRQLATAAAAAAAGVGGWLALGRGSRRPEAAPQVVYTLLDGQRVSSADFAGQVLLVNFWATTCSLCVAEMPHLVSTFEKFRGRGYRTVAVAMRHDPPAYVADFAESRKLPFGVAIDNTGEIARSFGDVQVTPTSVLINRRGEIVERHVGAPDIAALHRLIEQLLAES
jgi:peroxiredoxin